MLTRATTVLGILFMVGSMALAIMGQRGTGSVLSGLDGPGFQQAEPATLPVDSTPTAAVEDTEVATDETPEAQDAATETPAADPQ